MDRLNYFHPYQTKNEGHEDHLTRAYMVLLRYSFHATSSFYQYCTREAIKSSNLEFLQIPDWSELMTTQWKFATQKSNPKIETDWLVSVLISDKSINAIASLERSERSARYDGILEFGNRLTFVVENKPSSGNVWFNQLSPSQKNLGDETHLVSSPIQLEWKSIVQGLTALLDTPFLTGQEKLLIGDFLDFVDHYYPLLNPYDNFAMCKGNKALLQRRIENLLKDIVSDPEVVAYNNRWGYYIWIRYEEILQLGLILHWSSADQWHLELTMYYGDSVRQSRALYKHEINHTIFEKEPWQIKPHFHIAVQSQNLVWFHSPDLKSYIDYWKQQPDKVRQYKKEEARAFLGKLNEDSIISLDSVTMSLLNKKAFDTRIPAFNFCPGISVVCSYNSAQAIQLDNDGNFQSELKTRIKEGLSLVPLSQTHLESVLK